MAYRDEEMASATIPMESRDPLAREELTKTLKQYEDRRMRLSAALDHTQKQAEFLAREVQTYQQACEALHGIIRRSEEVDAVAEPGLKAKW